MRPRHHKEWSIADDPFDPAGGGYIDSVWQRPVRALLGESATESVQATAENWPDLNDGQQRIAAAIMSHCSLTAASGAALVDQQRTWLRAGSLRRSEDIETLTALVRLLVERPLTAAGEVAEVHRAYEHLRQCHWWPSGPEDLPLAALLVASPVLADDPITRIEHLHLALSEGDEVPDDPCALVAWCGTVSVVSDEQLVLRVRNLRTELLLSGIPLQEDDHAAVAALATIDQDAETVMREFIAQRCQGQSASSSRPAPLAIALAADAVVLRHLTGAARSTFIATLAIRGWIAGRHRH